MGQEVRRLIDARKVAGNHQVEWDGTDNSGQAVTTGLYLYQIKAGDLTMIKKMMLMK